MIFIKLQYIFGVFMMTRITHTIAGLTVATAYIGMAGNHTYLSAIPVLLAGAIGGTLPDIDYHLGDARKTNTIWKHRGIGHTLLFLALCIAGFVYVGKYAHYNLNQEMMVFSLAFLSHLILDSFTMVGVPFLYPLTIKGFCLRLFRVGTIQEYGLITLPLLVFLVLTGIHIFPSSDIQYIFHNQYF